MVRGSSNERGRARGSGSAGTRGRGRGRGRGLFKGGTFQPVDGRSGGRGRGRGSRGRGRGGTVSTTHDSWFDNRPSSNKPGRSSIGLLDDRTRDRDRDRDQARDRVKSQLTDEERQKLGLRVTVTNKVNRDTGVEKPDLRDDYEKQSDLLYGGVPEPSDHSERLDDSRGQHAQDRRDQGTSKRPPKNIHPDDYLHVTVDNRDRYKEPSSSRPSAIDRLGPPVDRYSRSPERYRDSDRYDDRYKRDKREDDKPRQNREMYPEGRYEDERSRQHESDRYRTEEDRFRHRPEDDRARHDETKYVARSGNEKYQERKDDNQGRRPHDERYRGRSDEDLYKQKRYEEPYKERSGDKYIRQDEHRQSEGYPRKPETLGGRHKVDYPIVEYDHHSENRERRSAEDYDQSKHSRKTDEEKYKKEKEKYMDKKYKGYQKDQGKYEESREKSGEAKQPASSEESSDKRLRQDSQDRSSQGSRYEKRNREEERVASVSGSEHSKTLKAKPVNPKDNRHETKSAPTSQGRDIEIRSIKGQKRRSSPGLKGDTKSPKEKRRKAERRSSSSSSSDSSSSSSDSRSRSSSSRRPDISSRRIRSPSQGKEDQLAKLLVNIIPKGGGPSDLVAHRALDTVQTLLASGKATQAELKSVLEGLVGRKQETSKEKAEVRIKHLDVEDDMYADLPETKIDPTASPLSIPEAASSAFIPGLAETMNVDDEDKFLYGEDDVEDNSDNVVLNTETNEEHKDDPAFSSDLMSQPFKEEIDSYDNPVLQNVLKTIGFDFELSKLMQDKAKKKREQEAKKDAPDNLPLNPGASYLGGGLKDIDLGSVFNPNESKESESEQKVTKNKILKNVSAQSYEERAKQYLQERQKLYTGDLKSSQNSEQQSGTIKKILVPKPKPSAMKTQQAGKTAPEGKFSKAEVEQQIQKPQRESRYASHFDDQQYHEESSVVDASYGSPPLDDMYYNEPGQMPEYYYGEQPDKPTVRTSNLTVLTTIDTHPELEDVAPRKRERTDWPSRSPDGRQRESFQDHNIDRHQYPPYGQTGKRESLERHPDMSPYDQVGNKDGFERQSRMSPYGHGGHRDSFDSRHSNISPRRDSLDRQSNRSRDGRAAYKDRSPQYRGRPSETMKHDQDPYNQRARSPHSYSRRSESFSPEDRYSSRRSRSLSPRSRYIQKSQSSPGQTKGHQMRSRSPYSPHSFQESRDKHEKVQDDAWPQETRQISITRKFEEIEEYEKKSKKQDKMQVKGTVKTERIVIPPKDGSKHKEHGETKSKWDEFDVPEKSKWEKSSRWDKPDDDNRRSRRDYEREKQRYSRSPHSRSSSRRSRSTTPRKRSYSRSVSMSPPHKKGKKSSKSKEGKSDEKGSGYDRKPVSFSLDKTQRITAQERNKLAREHEEREKRLKALEVELHKLHNQQNALMRKKQKQKDGHKDPQLLQNTKLQEEISKQISVLRKKASDSPLDYETADIPLPKDNSEDKKASKKTKYEEPKKDVKMEIGKEQRKPTSKDAETESKKMKSDSKESKKKDMMKPEDTSKVKEEKKSEKKSKKMEVQYEFFDQGNHWCKLCNTVCGNLFEMFQHLLSHKHDKNVDYYDRPWMPDSVKNPSKKKGSRAAVLAPVKGVEFLIPTKAFYCKLCKEFTGDAACAEAHLKTSLHNNNYLAFLEENSFYEQRYNLDRAAGLSRMKSKDETDDVPTVKSEPLVKATEPKQTQESKSAGSKKSIKSENEGSKRSTQPKGEKEMEQRKDQSDSDKSSDASRISIKFGMAPVSKGNVLDVRRNQKPSKPGFIMPLPKYRKQKGQLAERKEDHKDPKEEPAALDTFLSIKSDSVPGKSTKSVPVRELKRMKQDYQTDKKVDEKVPIVVLPPPIPVPPMGPNLLSSKSEPESMSSSSVEELYETYFKESASSKTVSEGRLELCGIVPVENIPEPQGAYGSGPVPVVCFAPALGAVATPHDAIAALPAKVASTPATPLPASYMYAPSLGSQKKRGSHARKEVSHQAAKVVVTSSGPSSIPLPPSQSVTCTLQSIPLPEMLPSTTKQSKTDEAQVVKAISTSESSQVSKDICESGKVKNQDVKELNRNEEETCVAKEPVENASDKKESQPLATDAKKEVEITKLTADEVLDKNEETITPDNKQELVKCEAVNIEFDKNKDIKENVEIAEKNTNIKTVAASENISDVMHIDDETPERSIIVKSVEADSSSENKVVDVHTVISTMVSDCRQVDSSGPEPMDIESVNVVPEPMDIESVNIVPESMSAQSAADTTDVASSNLTVKGPSSEKEEITEMATSQSKSVSVNVEEVTKPEETKDDTSEKCDKPGSEATSSLNDVEKSQPENANTEQSNLSKFGDSKNIPISDKDSKDSEASECVKVCDEMTDDEKGPGGQTLDESLLKETKLEAVEINKPKDSNVNEKAADSSDSHNIGNSATLQIKNDERNEDQNSSENVTNSESKKPVEECVKTEHVKILVEENTASEAIVAGPQLKEPEKANIANPETNSSEVKNSNEISPVRETCNEIEVTKQHEKVKVKSPRKARVPKTKAKVVTKLADIEKETDAEMETSKHEQPSESIKDTNPETPSELKLLQINIVKIDLPATKGEITKAAGETGPVVAAADSATSDVAKSSDVADDGSTSTSSGPDIQLVSDQNLLPGILVTAESLEEVKLDRSVSEEPPTVLQDKADVEESDGMGSEESDGIAHIGSDFEVVDECDED